MKLPDQTCPWSGCHCVNAPQHPLTGPQAAVLPALIAATAGGLLRCSRCGAVYVPRTSIHPSRPLGFVEAFGGYHWVSWGMERYDSTSAPRPLGAAIFMSPDLQSL